MSNSAIINQNNGPGTANMKRKMLNKDSLQSARFAAATPLKQSNPTGISNASNPKRLDQLSSPAFGASAFSPGAIRNIPPTPVPTAPVKSEFGAHFRDRKTKGKKELVYGEHISFPINADESPNLCQISVVDGQQTKGYRYMYEKLTEKGDLLNERINYFATIFAPEIINLRKKSSNENETQDNADDENNEEEYLPGQELKLFEHPSKVSQETQFYIGRISCDSVLEGSRLNLQSLVLETSREIGAGARVKIDFSGLVAKGIPLTLFPGMIVCVEASNPSGSCLCVVNLLESPKLNPPTTSGDDYISFYPDGKKQDLSIIFASGPFTLNDSLEYEPLEELIDVAMNDPPNLLLLMGPFVDIDHPHFHPSAVAETDLTFEEVFRLKFAPKLEKLKKMMPFMQIVLVPSQKEATLEWVAYPQPPIGSSIRDHDHIEKLQQLGLMNRNGDVWANLFPNPVQFTCNEVVIGLSNLDTIRDLIQLGMTVNPPQNSNTSENAEQKESIVPRDKFTTCFANILGQRHFYPVFPPTAGACIDSTRALGSQPQDPCVLQVRPDILIMPSRLQYSIKNVDDCVCINPGFLVKGRTGGTLCKIKVHPLQKEGMSADDVFENSISERSKVEIIKV